uniref:Preprotein translocase subunit YajC n=1 Tax=Meloidogyne hapla TaxID=6305 RepID=A0A1I8BDG7_MELHA
MPKQEFDAIDMMGPVVAALIFAVVVFMGAKINVRLGPHTMTQIKRGGYVSTLVREEEEQHRKMTLSLDKQQTEHLINKNENMFADGEAKH